jgi:probable rRNA maturation factor
VRKIRFYFEDIKEIKIVRNHIKYVIEQIFLMEGSDYVSIDIIFCSDVFLLKLNKEFLKHNFLTDIITFNNSEDNFVSGELYISLERVKENAKKFDVTYKSEIYRVIIHGILHLLNYEDKTSEKKKKMREKEDYYLLIVDKRTRL